MVLTGEGQVRRLSAADTRQPVEAFANIRVPKGFVAKDARARRDHGISAARTWWQDLLWLLLAALMGIAGYLLSWTGWFRSARRH